MGKSNPGGPLDWGFPTGRGNPGRGSCKGILKGTSPPGEKGGPISNFSRKNTLGSGKRKFLEEKGEREETTHPTPTSVLLPGETKRGERSSLSDRKKPHPLTPSRRDFPEGESLLSKRKEKENNWGNLTRRGASKFWDQSVEG